MTYRVSWSIDVDAESPERAAYLARQILREQLEGNPVTAVFPPIFQVTSEDGKTVMEVELA